GNYRSTWHYSGGYDPVSKALFTDENVDAYFLEFDSDRAGGFEPLSYVSGEKQVVLGLITSKEPELEDVDAIVNRIHEAAKYIRLESIYGSPPCRFTETEEGNEQDAAAQENKHTVVKENTHEVWL